jgi:carbamoyl-phosphate synthase large subunit
LDYLINREINLVINIPFNPKSDDDLDYFIRRRAVEFGIPVITNIELAKTLVKALINKFER